ncbi:unnamed protein product [Ceratitis capitata]|uniref:(Mediterranean fruit fly) hypothetical protein n=1 Tax=Ceratitis capitata TaxID=7213 RepID=A0A811UDL7_CERCA|nr:unnamed protein product [Ceratitis capitata]
MPHSITGEELAFVFGAPLAPAGPFPSNAYGVQEKLLSEAVMTYWTNFAKTGSLEGQLYYLHALEWDRYDLDWPEFNKRTQSYMNIECSIQCLGMIITTNWTLKTPEKSKPDLNAVYTYKAAIGKRWSIPPSIGYKYRQIYMNFGIKTNSGTGVTQNTYPPQRHGYGGTGGGGGEVITGHMSQFGTRDNGAEDAEDPVRR